MHRRGLRCGQQRPCQSARRKGKAVFWGGLIPCIPVTAWCTFSYLVLQVISFNVHLGGGKKNTHKKSITEHSRLLPSELHWAPTAIPEGYSDLERTRKTKHLTPLLLFWQTQTLSMCQKVTAPNGVFLVEFWFFHYGSLPPHLPILLQMQPNLEGTEKLLTPWANWAEDDTFPFTGGWDGTMIY